MGRLSVPASPGSSTSFADIHDAAQREYRGRFLIGHLPDPALWRRLLGMLADVADNRDSEMLAPNLRNPGGAVRTNAARGFKAPSARITLLEVEDHRRQGDAFRAGAGVAGRPDFCPLRADA